MTLTKGRSSMTSGLTDDELAALPLMFRDGLFKDHVVLVSGAGRGLGKAIAFQFARLGAKLVICGRTPEPLEATASALRKLGADVLAMPTNIRKPVEVAQLFDAAFARFSRLDHLINNAGGQFPQAAIDFTVKGW